MNIEEKETWIVYCCSKHPILKKKGYLYHFPRKEFNNYQEAMKEIDNQIKQIQC